MAIWRRRAVRRTAHGRGGEPLWRWRRILGLAWSVAALLAVLALLALLQPAHAADPPPDLSWLSADERAWLAAHPVVRIGVDPGYAPYAFIDQRGLFQGVAADTLALLGPMLGLRFDLVRQPTWAAVLEAARAQRIDLVTTAVQVPEREEFLAFSRIYIHTPLVVMTRQETQDYATPDVLADLRVALVEGYSSSRQVLARYPTARPVWVKSAAAGLIAVAEGNADAYVGVLGVNQHQARRLGLANLKVNVGFELRRNGQRLAVRRDWAPLARILSKALDRIPEAEHQAILQRWVPTLPPVPRESAPSWSAAQAKWLASAPEIRVGVEDDQEPFSFFDRQGRPAGLLVDLLRAIGQRSGLQLRWVRGNARGLVDRWRNGEVDVLLRHRELTEREAGLIATAPLYQSSYLVACRRGDDCAGGLPELAGRRVAVRRGGPAHDELLRQDRVHAVPIDTLVDALRMLQSRRVDAVLGEARSLLRAYDEAQPTPTGLVFGGSLGDGSVQMQMAVRGDWPELAAVLNRALDSIPPEQLAALRTQWLGPALPPGGLDRAQVLRYVGFAAAVVALFGGMLLWSNRRLRREVDRRRQAQEALAQARDLAETASRHKSEFVAYTSHELRTPLNAIVGMLHLLRDSPLQPAQQRHLEILGQAADSLLRLIDDLLDLARIEAGQLRLQPVPFDLPRRLEATLHLVRDEAQRRGLGLRADLDPALPRRVVGDADRLQQVLVNLLGNAVKYTEAGAILLAVRCVERGDSQATLDFSVQDSGPGIAPEWQQRVFDPFVRLQTTPGLPSPERGVGLGLAISRTIVELMGGRLALDSRIGAGSRFHFRVALPLAGDAAPAAIEADATDAAPPAPGCALLVEDNEVNRLVADAVLKRGGWHVVEAASGRDALLTLQERAGQIDVVLLDLGLPDLDGLEVLRRLREMDGPAGRLPVVALTARAMPQERDACLAAGAHDVVLKPFEPARLWQAIGSALRDAAPPPAAPR